MPDLQVHPWPVAGQFWMWASPLSLLRITFAGSPDDPITCQRWTPLGADDAVFIDFRALAQGAIPLVETITPQVPEHPYLKEEGSAWRTPDGTYVFIGPSAESYILFLAPRPLSEHDYMMRTFVQPGPATPPPALEPSGPRTVLQRVAGTDEV